MELHDLTIAELHDSLAKGEVKVEELVSHFTKRIEALDPKLHAYLDKDVVQPAKIDVNSSVLAGIPFSVKDNLVVAGSPARASSKILEGFVSPYTATALDKLLKADGIILGRTNCDEFGMGSSTENSAYGPTRNPWDPERVPGGSSGGSAAAVAAGLVPYALGSDTGGSIRQPAAFCGIVGIKPTYGRVSRFGLIALASSLDTVGPLTKTVADSAYVLEKLAGFDPMDATTVDVEVPKYSESVDKGVAGLRIGVPKECFGQGLEPAVEKAVREAIQKFKDLGAEISEISLPSSPYALAAYYIILPVEASANLSRYDGIRYGFRTEGHGNLLELYSQTRGQGFGPEVKRRLMLGTFASSSGYYDAYYKQALNVQNHIKAELREVFKTVDCLIMPTTPNTTFKIGEKANDPLGMYLNDVYSVTANIAGIPAISIPCGFADNLPVGLQLMAPWFKEETLFQAGGAYEASTNWAKIKPEIK